MATASNIVEFQRPETPRKPDEEWVGDEATCIACGHKWVAVSRIGTRWLECPGCSCMKGVYTKPFGASEGDSHFVCKCGSEAMTAYYDRQGLFYFRCMNCGVDHTEAIFGT